MLRICLVVTIVAGVLAVPAPSELQINKVFDTEKRIAEDGFTSESHHVVTSDGYILEINRIPNGRHPEEASDKPVVFLMHGLQGSALSYCMIGPELSPAYNYADAGFDVWMGNARGVLNSRNHISLDADQPEERKEFFDFSFEEIALIDLPAMIEYVLEYTGKEKLHYVGHSQGGTVFLVLNSLKPVYNEKFASVHLLAAVGYQNHFPTYVLNVAAKRTDLIYAFTVWRGFVEIFGPEWNDITDCDSGTSNSIICELNLIKEVIDIAFGEMVVFAGSSLKQFAHYGQNIRDKSFRRWDHGLLNFIKYGSFTPPNYNLELITANVTMHYTVNDMLLSEQDVLDMADVMPNTDVRKVAREDFRHTEFATANDAKELVTDYIIEEIQNYNKHKSD